MIPLLESHLNRLVLAGYRPSTIVSRRKVVTAYVNSLACTPVEATRMDVEAFLARSLAPESRRAYRNHLKMFYAWLIEEGYASTDPTERVPPIRVPRAMPRPMSDTDLKLALDAATPRMRAWLLLMCLGGLRCLEVAALRPDGLHMTESGALLFLRECKGGGTASVPAHPAVVGALSRLRVTNGLWWGTNAAQVSRTVNVHLRRCGIAATAHSLRHTAATSWFRESGHDLLTTAALMRHTNVQTTTTYAQLDPVRPAAVVRLVKVPA